MITASATFTGENVASVMAAVRLGVFAGVKKTADAITETAKSYCPVRTGDLRASIEPEIEDNGVAIVATVAPRGQLLKSPWRDVLTYGVFVELGTRKMAAQPYLRPAIDAESGQFVELIRAEVGSAL